jgi:hypothetical protein
MRMTEIGVALPKRQNEIVRLQTVFLLPKLVT